MLLPDLPLDIVPYMLDGVQIRAIPWPVKPVNIPGVLYLLVILRSMSRGLILLKLDHLALSLLNFLEVRQKNSQPLSLVSVSVDPPLLASYRATDSYLWRFLTGLWSSSNCSPFFSRQGHVFLPRL